EAAQINEAGQVVGNTRDEGYTMLPYLWQAGTTTYLYGNYDWINGYYLHAYALGMNASGVVVGWAQTLVPIPSGLYDEYGPQYIYVAEQHASVWQNGGPWDLGTLPNGHFNAAYSINTAGQILGVAQDPSGPSPPIRGGKGMTALANEVPAGWTLTSALAINDAGLIAANANGHAVLLTSVPPPPTLAISNASVAEGN